MPLDRRSSINQPFSTAQKYVTTMLHEHEININNDNNSIQSETLLI